MCLPFPQPRYRSLLLLLALLAVPGPSAFAEPSQLKLAPKDGKQAQGSQLKARKKTAAASFNPQSDITVSAIPPRPERKGLGWVIAGWSIFGVGALTSVGFGPMGAYYDAEPLIATSISAGVIGLGGLAMAIIGHVKRSSSLEQQEQWDELYKDLGPAASLEIVPLIGPQRKQLSVSIHF